MLNREEITAMQQIYAGADVYSRPLAETLRKIEKNFPSYIDICKPQAYKGDGTDQMPYFGAQVTAEGALALADAMFAHKEPEPANKETKRPAFAVLTLNNIRLIKLNSEDELRTTMQDLDSRQIFYEVFKRHDGIYSRMEQYR